MSASSQEESVALPAELRNNKCALKLLGLDFGDLNDEVILELISNYVQPSSIKALFYDSYNSFYVLHLGDIESTCHLIGKTLQIGTHYVNFLPLVDCFVIGNVYLSLSNKQLREIFSVFGNVCEVENYHVLPNSSKFFHVLSGTREISFLLPGADSEVQIPVTVVHPPYTFHVKQKCLGCLTQGHSLMNCPDKEEEESPKISKNDSPKRNDEKNVVINIMQVQEMTFEVSGEEKTDEKTTENVSSNVKTIKKDVSEENVGLAQKTLHSISRGVKKGKGIRKIAAFSNRKKLKGLSANKKNIASSDNSKPDFEHTSNLPKIIHLDFPPSVEALIMKSEGVIPTNALVELMYIDARNRRNIISFVLQFTSNIPGALSQLRKLQTDLVQQVKVLNPGEAKFRHKLWSIIRMLNRYQRG